MKKYTIQELIIFAENPEIKNILHNDDNDEYIFLSNDCIPKNINLRKIFKELIQSESYKDIHYRRFESGYLLSLNLGFSDLSVNVLTEYFFSIISKKDQREYKNFPNVFTEDLYYFIIGFNYAKATQGFFIIQSLDDIICNIGYRKRNDVPYNFKLDRIFLKHVLICTPELIFKDIEFPLSRIAFKLGFLLRLHEKKSIIKELHEDFFHVLFIQNFITDSESYANDILNYFEWFKLGCDLWLRAISFIW